MSGSQITQEHDGVGGINIKINGWTYVQIHYDYRYTDNASRALLASRIVDIISGNSDLDRLRTRLKEALNWIRETERRVAPINIPDDMLARRDAFLKGVKS